MIVLALGVEGVRPLRLTEANARTIVAVNHRRHRGGLHQFKSITVAQDGALWRVDLGRSRPATQATTGA